MALVTAALLSPIQATAGGLYLNEFATPSMGTAGAGQEAFADDASTAFALHNPAGMTRIDGHEISLGAGLLIGNSEFDPDDNTPFDGGDGGDQAGLAPLLGTHAVASVTDDLKLGFSVFSITGASLDPNDSWTGRYQLEEITLLTVSANPSAAYRVNDWLSVAGGVVVMYADLDFELAAPPINPPTGGDGGVEVDGNDWATGFNLGSLIELGPGTRIGVTYASKLEPSFNGDLDADTAGGSFSASSDTELTFPQLARVGAYHELNEQWAVLATVGWEDWSDFDSFDVSTSSGGASIETNWRDTYHFSGGLHYRPTEDWLLQTGVTYDTSPVSDGNRQAYLPIDRQIRVAVGAQHDYSEKLSFGGALEYIDLGDADIDSNSLQGTYDTNYIIALSLNMSYKF